MSAEQGGHMGSIPVFSADVAPAQLDAALRDAGCAVVRDVVNPAVRDRLTDELRPHVEIADPEAGRAVNALYEAEADGLGYRDFYQGNTRRVISMIRKSPTFRTL